MKNLLNLPDLEKDPFDSYDYVIFRMERSMDDRRSDRAIQKRKKNAQVSHVNLSQQIATGWSNQMLP